MVKWGEKTVKELRYHLVRWLYIVSILFSGKELCAQKPNSFDRLTAEALNQSLDMLNAFRFKNYNAVDTNYYLFVSDYDRNYVLDEMRPPFYGVLKKGKRSLWLGRYQINKEDNKSYWHFTKKVRPHSDKYVLHVILKPHYDFSEDTLIIHISVADYYRVQRKDKKGKCWSVAVGYWWGNFRYVYSTEEKRWISVGYETGGI